jgi:hypothetical protein
VCDERVTSRKFLAAIILVVRIAKEKARDAGLSRASWQEDFEPLYTDADRTGFLVGPWANAPMQVKFE